MIKYYLLSISLISATAFAQEYRLFVPSEKIKLSEYCKISGTKVVPNYDNDDVKKAYDKLTKVAPMSFYFYMGPLKTYGLKKPAKEATPEQAGKVNADIFLTLLCGEFRDRPTLVHEKLMWIHNLYKLPVEEQKPIDPKKNLWSQISARSYQPYNYFSSSLWMARSATKVKFNFGNEKNVDGPVEGQLMCETKAIFSEYVVKGKPFSTLEDYNKTYEAYAGVPGNCTEEEKNTYYDFRGDSNFKPNSPESNGMIWYSSSVTSQCESQTKAKEGQAGTIKITDQDCKDYFKNPFASRWNAARAGLGTWILRDKKHDSVFSEEGEPVYIIPHREASKRPFSFRFDKDELNDFLSVFNIKTWMQPDMGFNQMTNLGSQMSEADKEFAYARLRDAVNRHTDWYSSGFDDKMGMNRDQAYSPFVASSYEMSKSDGFTAPGVTVNSPADGFKHWMFVFKVKKENWYNTKSIAEGKPVDFEKHWFDETSLGTNGLAKTERAWDRLGSPLEGEYDSIIYLHNITTSGEVKGDGIK